MASNKFLLAIVGLCVLSLSVAPAEAHKHANKLSEAIYEIVAIVFKTVFTPGQIGDILIQLKHGQLTDLIKQVKPDVLKKAIAERVSGEYIQNIVQGLPAEDLQAIFGDAANDLKNQTPKQLVQTVQNLSADKLALLALKDPKQDPIQKLKAAIAEEATGVEIQDILSKLSPADLQDIFGDPSIKDQSPEQLVKAVQNLTADKLALLSSKDSKPVAGAIVQSLPEEVLGKELVRNLEEHPLNLKPTDIKAFVEAIMKYFTED